MLRALSRIIDPDFGMDIVACGFVKDLAIDGGSGRVTFRLELTTPACPIKDEFERKVRCQGRLMNLVSRFHYDWPVSKLSGRDAFEVSLPTCASRMDLVRITCSAPCTRQ